MRRVWLVLSCLACIALTAACGREPAPSAPPVIGAVARGALTLQAVPFSDLAGTDGPVRDQLRQRYAAVAALLGTETSDLVLAGAFGELGRLLMAAELLTPAEAAFSNAELLMPGDTRWPYYLGHIYRRQGEVTEAVTAFERVLRRRSGDLVTLIWLGRIELQRGRPEIARERFSQALVASPDWPVAVAGLGQAALAERHFGEAVTHLERALAASPSASALHYPLGMAYRALGDLRQAEMHLAQRGDVELLPEDPLIEALEALLESPLAYQRRGLAASDRQAWSEAAALFRRGLELAGRDGAMRHSLRHKLGTALFMQGDMPAALAEFEAVQRAAPAFAPNRYSLGVVMTLSGRHEAAIEQFRAAVQADPDYGEARLSLADALRRTGRDEASLAEYAAVLRLHPGEPEAQFGSAMALLRLGRLEAALARLEEGRTANPGEWRFPHALARVLATASNARIRDGRRALAVTEQVERTSGMTIDLAETRAAALAELGRFVEAVGWQREVVATLRSNNDPAAATHAASVLALYEQRQRRRTPYPDDHPVFHPGATRTMHPVGALAAAESRAGAPQPASR